MNSTNQSNFHSLHPVNSYWVVPGRFLAGEYPGHITPEQSRKKLASYLDAGIDAFLDLTEKRELSPYEADLQVLAASRHVSCLYKRMPIRDVSVPSNPDQMRKILGTLEQWLEAGRNVYVHCWGGVGRTGTVVGCYLVNKGMSGGEALAQIDTFWKHMSPSKRQRKPVSPETPAQMEYVRCWLA